MSIFLTQGIFHAFDTDSHVCIMTILIFQSGDEH